MGREDLRQIHDKTVSSSWHPDSLTGLTSSGHKIQIAGGMADSLSRTVEESSYKPRKSTTASKRAGIAMVQTINARKSDTSLTETPSIKSTSVIPPGHVLQRPLEDLDCD